MSTLREATDQGFNNKANRPLMIAVIMPAKNHPAASGLTQMNTAMHNKAIRMSLTASPMTALRKNALLSGPNFGATTIAKTRLGMKDDRLPNIDE